MALQSRPVLQSIPGQFNPVTQNYNAVLGNNAGATNYSPVLGASTSNSNFLSAPSLPSNNNPFTQAQNSAQSQTDAGLAAANAQWQYNLDQANNQEQALGGQKDASIGKENTNFQDLTNQVGDQKLSSENNTNDAITQAASTARNTQLQNRNILRALGILNSTYATDKLQAPNNAFDTQRAQLVKTNTENVNKLDQFMTQQTAVHQQAVQSIESQYSNLVGQIHADKRFNDNQKLAAVQQANAALQSTLGNIAQSYLSWQNQVDAQKQQYSSAVSGIGTTNPTYDPNAITSQSLGSTVQQSTPSQVGVNGLLANTDPRKRLSALG